MQDQPVSTNPKPIGKSLWSDAMRKLRRNRVAMICAWTLVAVALGAFFTPFLPLQPSAKIVSERAFEKPRPD